MQMTQFGVTLAERRADPAGRQFTLWLRSRSVTHSGVSCRLTAVVASRQELQPPGYLAAPAT
jgi:hypothetical protein